MKQGFTLIEVIIFTAILSIFLVMVLSMTTSSLSTMKTAERKMYATRYAEELLDWVSAEKENDWDNTFLPRAPLTTPTVYCFNGAITSTWPSAGACPGYALNGFFKRELSLSRQANVTPGDYQVTATITVSWLQGGVMSVPITTIYNKYE